VPWGSDSNQSVQVLPVWERTRSRRAFIRRSAGR
jgi:hypothetical protein